MAGDNTSGALRKRVSSSASGRKIICQIEKDQGATTSPDGQGGYTSNWQIVTGLANVPMTFRTWSPYQQFLAQQRYPGVNVRMFMRYRRSAKVDETMRAVYGNHIYLIRGAENYDQDNDTIILYCEELQATGSVR